MSKVAIFETGAKQFSVGEGDLIQIPHLEGNAGDPVAFDHVMLLREKDATQTGQPYVEGARIVGEIVKQGRDDKVIVFKMKRRTTYRKKNGHRQLHTVVRITGIEP